MTSNDEVGSRRFFGSAGGGISLMIGGVMMTATARATMTARGTMTARATMTAMVMSTAQQCVDQ